MILDHQHRGTSMSSLTPLPVLGYTDQSAANVALVNENKLLEELLSRQLDLLVRSSSEGFDQRLVAIARTHFMEGFMAMNRAIFKPTRMRNDQFDPAALANIAERLATQ
jgi:hypothetical protein